MTDIVRKLNLTEILEDQSIFLLGPRQTGKTTYLRRQLKGTALSFNLLDSKIYREFLRHPERLEERVRPVLKNATERTIIVIDEVQRVPEVLAAVQNILTDFPNARFILTGSSARKLHRDKNINLLGGRAARVLFHGLTTDEIADTNFSIEDQVQWGTLPSVLLAKNRALLLDSYVDLYLKEEIVAEAITRKLADFERFLETSALCQGQQVVFAKIASDMGIDQKTCRSWFQVLEDTLIGHLLPCFDGTKRRKAVSSAKFYFFDPGIANALLGRLSLRKGTPEYGVALETLVHENLRARIDSTRNKAKLFYWRSVDHYEVDFVVQHRSGVVAIEVKGSEALSKSDFRGLRALADEEIPGLKKIVVCHESMTRETSDGVLVLPVAQFFCDLWSGAIF
jgi:predicted AAA+ superfamily ATPase